MRIDELAGELIDRHHLHANGFPVDLAPLEDSFRIQYEDLTGTGLNGFARLSKRLPPSPRDPAIIVIDRNLTSFDRRITYAHEVAHAYMGHQGSLRCESVTPWLDDRQEREAWLFAARLLIPEPLDLYDWSEPNIAANCMVPPGMVRLWKSLW